MTVMKASRGVSVREMRSHTRTVLATYRAARRATGVAIRQALLRNRALVVASLRSAFASGGSLSQSAGTRRRGLAHSQRLEAMGTGPPAAEDRAALWDLWPSPQPDEDRKADRSDELLQVMRVIQEHPEGICARDIGNELGTDWRQVLGLTRSLVDVGLVEQVEQAYYPVFTVNR